MASVSCVRSEKVWRLVSMAGTIRRF
jgi:hypothetical protein